MVGVVGLKIVPMDPDFAFLCPNVSATWQQIDLSDEHKPDNIC